MPQAVWSGTINFGLVSIPVKLYPATDPKDVRFHLYDRRTGRRVHYQRVTREYEPATFEPEHEVADAPRDEPASSERSDRRSREATEDTSPFDLPAPPVAEPTAEDVDADDLVRGIELPTGDFVTVSDEELESLAPERSRTIDIEEFVDLADIDPVFFEKSYYVAPTWRSGAEKPYVLLLRAMQAAGMVGIGRFVLRIKPHLVAIRPLERVLGLETLYFGDEVRRPEEVAQLPSVTVSERELKMAQQLVGAMATEWIPDKHADVYREELLELLRSKPANARAEQTEAAKALPSVDALMSALKASVDAAKRRSAGAQSTRTKKRVS